MTHGPLTVHQAVSLSTIVDMAIGNQRVLRLVEGGNVIDGVARSIGDERGNHAGPKDDVRDCYLRVSGTFEHFWPVSELLDEVGNTFVASPVQ